jgi:hypothetical protein
MWKVGIETFNSIERMAVLLWKKRQESTLDVASTKIEAVQRYYRKEEEERN